MNIIELAKDEGIHVVVGRELAPDEWQLTCSEGCLFRPVVRGGRVQAEARAEEHVNQVVEARRGLLSKVAQVHAKQLAKLDAPVQLALV